MSISALTTATIHSVSQFAYETVDGDGDAVHVYGATIRVTDGSRTILEGAVNAVVIPIPAINGWFGAENLMTNDGANRTIQDIVSHRPSQTAGQYAVKGDGQRRSRQIREVNVSKDITPIAGSGIGLEAEVVRQVPALDSYMRAGDLAMLAHDSGASSAIVLPFGGDGDTVELTVIAWYRPSNRHALYVPAVGGVISETGSSVAAANIVIKTAVGSINSSEDIGEQVEYRTPPKDDRGMLFLPARVFDLVEAKGTRDRHIEIAKVRTGSDDIRRPLRGSGIRAAITTAPRLSTITPAKIRSIS